jgi:hypothetical protein
VTSSARRSGLLAAVLLAGGLALGGCGDDGPHRTEDGKAAAGESRGEQVGTPPTVDCPAEASAVDLPEGFAAPLPEGTVVVDVQQRDGGRTVVTGVVPAGHEDVLAELQRAYPAAGLTLTEGETEERDAESNFEGDGVEGRWGIRVLPDCSPEATRIDVVVRTS